jgi:hypothetical protein
MLFRDIPRILNFIYYENRKTNINYALWAELSSLVLVNFGGAYYCSATQCVY